MVGAVIEQTHTHPEVISHFAALLESINERAGGGPGQDIEPLSTRWMDEVVRLAIDKSERLRREAGEAPDEPGEVATPEEIFAYVNSHAA